MLNDELQYPFGMILILSRSSTLSLKLLFLSTKEVLVMRRGWPPDIPLAGSFDGAYSGTSRTPSPTQNRECQTYSFSLNSVLRGGGMAAVR